jgi:hypothetical protein
MKPRVLPVIATSLLTLLALGDSEARGLDSRVPVRESASFALTTQQGIDWKAVDAAIGRSGTLQPGDVYRIPFPRADMEVTAAGVRLRPALALGSWVAFRAAPGGAMAMGDLVLAEDEVQPVLSRLQQGGVDVTALHHHVLHESPRVLYMHIEAHGNAVTIAETIHAALALTKTPPPSPTPSVATEPLGIDTAAIARTLGRSGRVNSEVYQLSVPRAETIREGGIELPPAMGVATAINFQPTGEGKAAITGDFVMLATEVNAVARALRESGIEVTSLHSHMLTEDPRLFFMHFWANDDALKLARGLRAALDRTNSLAATR